MVLWAVAACVAVAVACTDLTQPSLEPLAPGAALFHSGGGSPFSPPRDVARVDDAAFTLRALMGAKVGGHRSTLVTVDVAVGDSLFGPFPPETFFKDLEFYVRTVKTTVKNGKTTTTVTRKVVSKVKKKQLAPAPHSGRVARYTLDLSTISLGAELCAHVHIDGTSQPPPKHAGGNHEDSDSDHNSWSERIISGSPGRSDDDEDDDDDNDDDDRHHDHPHDHHHDDDDKASVKPKPAHLVGCTLVEYAVDVAAHSIDHPATVSFFDRPSQVVATMRELQANAGAEFDCVLEVNGQERGRLPNVRIASGGETTCTFAYRLSNAGTFNFTVHAEKIRQDIVPSNNSISKPVTVTIEVPGDEEGGGGGSGGGGAGDGTVLTPFCCNYRANEKYDTTLRRIRIRDVVTGAIIADSGFVEYGVTHDSHLDAYWDAAVTWPITRLAVAHKTGPLLFDDQKQFDVQAGGTGQCFLQEATTLVFGYTLCSAPFPLSGPLQGEIVTNLVYSHSFNPSAPVRRDLNSDVVRVFNGEISNYRSVIQDNPLSPALTGGVPPYGATMDFIISITSPDRPILVSGSGFDLVYSSGSDHPNWLSPDRPRSCVRIPNPDGLTLGPERCEWRFTFWGQRKGSGNIGDIFF